MCVLRLRSPFSVEGIVRTALGKLEFFDDEGLAQAMRTRVQSLQATLRHNLSIREDHNGKQTGIRLGFDYIVEARWPQ